MWKTQAPLFWTYVRKPLACWNHTNRTVFFWDGFMLPGPDALKLSKHSYSHVVFYIRAPGSFGISGFYSYKQWWFVSSSSFCSAAQWYCCCLEIFSSLTHSVAGDKLQLWPGVGRKQLRGHSSACPALAAVTRWGAQHLWDSRWEHWVPAAGRTRSLEPCTLPQWWFQTQDLWYFPYMLAMIGKLEIPNTSLAGFFFFLFRVILVLSAIWLAAQLHQPLSESLRERTFYPENMSSSWNHHDITANVVCRRWHSAT